MFPFYPSCFHLVDNLSISSKVGECESEADGSIDETTLEIASTMKTRTELSDSTDFPRDGHFPTQTFTIETGLDRVTIRHVQVALNGKILISYRSTKGWETILFDPKENHIMGVSVS